MSASAVLDQAGVGSKRAVGDGRSFVSPVQARWLLGTEH